MTTNASYKTTSRWLKTAIHQLEQSGIGTARLDCLVLLEDATGKDRAWLLAHPDYPLQGLSLKQVNKKIERRAAHEPLAYIRGKTEFYGREFIVNKDVLEPRPESETMIDLLKQFFTDRPWNGAHIVDVGTGSGALGLTAALEIPGITVDLIDIDPACIKVARKNQELHKVTAELILGDLLSPLSAIRYPLNAILANLPYVPDNFQINEAAMNEPKIAIFGGPDGLDLYRRLFHQIANNLQSQVLIFTECLPFQHAGLRKIAENAGFKQIAEDDFIQVFTPN